MGRRCACREQIEVLVDTFPSQSIDFFGALRSRVYDNAVREYIEQQGLEKLAKGILVSSRTQFEFDTPSMDLVRTPVAPCLPLLPVLPPLAALIRCSASPAASMTSCLLHAALAVQSTNTPVKALCRA